MSIINSGVNWVKIAESLATMLPLSLCNKKVLALLQKESTPWAIACSGGADSLALLLYIKAHFSEQSKNTTVLHYNHKLREESASEADFVEKCAENLDFIFIKKEGNPSRNAVSESELRKERHAFFRESLEKIKSKILLLGHHGDDLMETTLMRLTRGSGLSGLSAPRPVNNVSGGYVFARPFLNIRKSQIIESLKESSAIWCEDLSNRSDDYFRNRVRNYVIPALEEQADRDVMGGFSRSRMILEEDNEALDFWVDQLIFDQNDSINLHLLSGKPKALYRRSIHKFLINNGLNNSMSAKALDEFLEKIFLGESARMSIGGDRWVVFDGKLLACSEKEKTILWDRVMLDAGKEYDFPGEGMLSVEFIKLDDGLRSQIFKGTFSEDQYAFIGLEGEFSARQWQPGDRYLPLGAPGRRKLQDMFVDKKIPEADRKQLPVIEFKDGSVVWCPGLPVAEKAKIKDSTTCALRLTYTVNSLKIRHFEYE